MTHLLLLGAGFSRNWGGWLAAEAFEYLLGSPEVLADEYLRDLLWTHQGRGGGFEAALEALQFPSALDGEATRERLMALQSAIARMFADMNRAFFELVEWEFTQRLDRQIKVFLTRFDAIFTLNQDLLLERHYCNDNVHLVGARP